MTFAQLPLLFLIKPKCMKEVSCTLKLLILAEIWLKDQNDQPVKPE